MLTINCPLGATLPTVGDSSCGQSFGQYQKVIIQRTYSSGYTKNKVALADATDPSTWVALEEATDGTAIRVTPKFANPATEPGAPIQFGGGNATPDGIALNLGSEPTSFSAQFLVVNQSVIAQLKALKAEPNLSVYFIDQSGQIIGKQIATDFYPFEIQSFYISDMGGGQFDQPNFNNISFSLAENWSDDAVGVVSEDATFSFKNL